VKRREFITPTLSMARSFHIHLRGFFSSIAAQVAAAVIPPIATSSKTSSGVPIGVIPRTQVRIRTAASAATMITNSSPLERSSMISRTVLIDAQSRCDGHHEMLDFPGKPAGPVAHAAAVKMELADSHVTAAASFWRMPPSRPRGSQHSRALACDPHDGIVFPQAAS
jgi:hypothetical protein